MKVLKHRCDQTESYHEAEQWVPLKGGDTTESILNMKEGLNHQYTPEETKDLSRKREIVNAYLRRGGAFFVETGRLHVTEGHIRNAKGEMKRAKLQQAQTTSKK